MPRLGVAGLAASILHKNLVTVGQIKEHLFTVGIDVRPTGMSARSQRGVSLGAAALAVAVGVAIGFAVMRRR